MSAARLCVAGGHTLTRCHVAAFLCSPAKHLLSCPVEGGSVSHSNIRTLPPSCTVAHPRRQSVLVTCRLSASRNTVRTPARFSKEYIRKFCCFVRKQTTPRDHTVTDTASLLLWIVLFIFLVTHCLYNSMARSPS
jgi:hypothetical protein